MAILLSKRQNYGCYDAFGTPVNCSSSSWDFWGRWVFLAVAIVFIFLLCLMVSCISARRRRRLGRNPYYGTGWAANHGPWQSNYAPPPQNNPNTYYAYQQPAPPYNAGHYQREQQSGIELASPDQVYEPPQGPPPKKSMY